MPHVHVGGILGGIALPPVLLHGIPPDHGTQPVACNLSTRGFYLDGLLLGGGYNDKYRGLVTVDFVLSDFSAANPVTTAIWELEFFFGGRPSWKATGPQLQFGNSRFLGAAQWKATGLQLQSGNSIFFGGRSCCNRDFLGGRPSWKMTRLQL